MTVVRRQGSTGPRLHASGGALDAHCLLELGEGHRRLEPRRHVLERPRGEVVVVDIEDRSDEVGVSSEQIVEGVGKLLALPACSKERSWAI